MMRAKLRCQISAGQFSTEVAVVVRASSGREFSLFTDRSTVTVNRWPTDDQSVDGWVDVDTIEDKGDSLVLIRLPQSTLENGSYLTVHRGQLHVPRVPPEPAACAQ